jgi:hypothetical protein
MEVVVMHLQIPRPLAADPYIRFRKQIADPSSLEALLLHRGR